MAEDFTKTFTARMKEVDSARWAGSVEAQLETLRYLWMSIDPADKKPNRVLDNLLPHQKEQLLDLTGKGLGWTNGEGKPDKWRLDQLFDLSTLAAGRKVRDKLAQEHAITAVKAPRDLSQPGSNLYPTGGWLGSYLELVQQAESPLAYHFWTGISVLCAAMRRNIIIDRRAFKLFPNQYIMIIGPTATKKSTAMNRGVMMLETVNYYISATMESSYKAGTASEPAFSPEITILPNDASMEFYVNELKSGAQIDPRSGMYYIFKDACGYLMNDDVAELLGKDNVGSDRRVAGFTALYQGDEKRVRGTLAHGIHEMRNLCVNLFFGSTEEWIRKSVTPSLFMGGFMGRVTFIARNYQVPLPYPDVTDPILLRRLATLLVPWAVLQDPIIMRLDPKSEAGQWFGEWYIEHSNTNRKGTDDKLKAYGERKQERLLKLALALQVSATLDHREPTEIADAGPWPMELEHLKLALAILDSDESYLPEAFSKMAGQADSDKVARVRDSLHRLGKRHGGKFRKSQLTKSLSGVEGLTLVKDHWPFVEHLASIHEIKLSSTGGATWIEVTESDKP